jgi:DNA recombination protein RmuC
VGHLQKVSRSLESAVDSFNAAVGSVERNVLPQARKFTELGVTSETLPTVEPIDSLVRTPTNPKALEAEDEPPRTPS